jgi:hypothetical protein
MKLFIGVGRLYVDQVFHCKVEHKLPPGEYSVHVTQWDAIHKQTPVLNEGTRFYWGVQDPDQFIICQQEGKDSGFTMYQDLYKLIVDAINSHDDVVLTV